MDMELEHRRVDRPETEEEKMQSDQEPGSDNNHHETIRGKEKGLELLTRELDDKVRFRQRPVERPGSGSGRTGSYSERTHSRAGSIDRVKEKDLDHVVQSVRPVDDQPRDFQGGSKERGFFSNR
ncbi:hypothetical protein IGI04_008051 [Brassica rapa subsp. trilocularis]|uniref:Uncharacterized protein n=1 Tax=Brassica rapa subsp. trilocularis TaxID=1813537 RepID=A0ABQ7NLG7_BRACM|nr:hypothetical protein IGI04_008051 [Brassica rapa subsp. trilocularis]